jgi:hypothetical protein
MAKATLHDQRRGVTPKPKRGSKATSPRVPAATLFELLHAIDAAFKQKLDEPATLQTEQARYVAATEAIGRFLLKIHSPHADRFFDLSDTLADAAAGGRPPLLTFPKKRSVPNPTKIEAAKANVAFAVEALIALGERPEDAAKILLRKFPGIKNLAGRKSHRPDYPWHKIVLEWRKTLSAPSRKKNALAAEIFTVGRELIEKYIAEGRRAELKARALGRARYAERVAQSVFVRRSNTRG